MNFVVDDGDVQHSLAVVLAELVLFQLEGVRRVDEIRWIPVVNLMTPVPLFWALEEHALSKSANAVMD